MKLKKIYSLQLYRAVAAILVVLYHVTSYSHKKLNQSFLGDLFVFGHTGVDFFFVLSGFIIFYAHYKDIGQRDRIQNYFVRRSIRIFPIYWIITTIKLLTILIIPSIAKSYERDFVVIIKSYLLLPQENSPIIGPAWTLSYELLFYILFAMMIWIGIRWGKFIFVVWAALIIVINFSGVPDFQIFADNYLYHFIFNERNLEFIMGCLGAYSVINFRDRLSSNKILYTCMMVAGIVVYILSGIYLNKGYAIPSYAILFGIPSLFIVTGSAALEFSTFAKIPNRMIYIGDASYSIYLSQGMFINAFALFTSLMILMNLSVNVLGLLMATFTVFGGVIVYMLVEYPVISRLKNEYFKYKKKGSSL